MVLTYLIASVWLANGLFCKALDLVVNAWTQIALVLCMNIVEFLLAPDLLL